MVDGCIFADEYAHFTTNLATWGCKQSIISTWLLLRSSQSILRYQLHTRLSELDWTFAEFLVTLVNVILTRRF